MTMVEPADITRFWIEEIGPRRWYDSDPGLDRMVRDRFRAAWDDAPALAPRWAALGTQGALAALILLLTNADTLDGWARDLPPSAYAERAVEVTGQWAALTGRFGLGTPHAALHARWKKAEAAKFD